MTVSGTAELAIYSSPGVSSWTTVDLANGNKGVQGMRVFRAGTFRDSIGIQRTWTVEHLHQMVQNFEALRGDVFPNVPVKADHFGSVNDVVGYLTRLSVEGEYLAADWEATEPDAFEKLNRGTYRSRSLEVGMYETNDEAFYWPVVHGFAFVDIPAVEGLHRGDKTIACYSAVDTKEPPVTTSTTPPTTPPPTPTPAPPTTPEPSEPKATFRVGGASVSDFAAVQTHIDRIEAENATLEKFRAETTAANRTAFVEGLATSKKIIQPQVEGFKKLVGTMTDEQFTEFRATYDAAPVQSLLADHSAGSTSNPDGQQGGQAVEARVVLEETVDMLRRSGMRDEQLAKTGAYQKLAALNAAGAR